MTEEQMQQEALFFYWQIKDLKDQNNALYLLGLGLSNKVDNDQAGKLLTLVNKLLIQYKEDPNSAPKIAPEYVSYTGISFE